MKNNSLLWSWLIFAVLAFTWGSSFILMKFGLQSFNAIQIGMLRISFAFLFTVVIGFKHFKALSKSNWKALLIVGLFGNGIPYVLFPLAVTQLDSGLVGILNSLVPLFTLFVGVLWFGIKVKWQSIVGICVGLFGAMWLLIPDMRLDPSKLIYGAYPIIATVCYAISINTINSHLKDLGAFAITLLSLLFIGIPAIIYVLSSGFVEIMQTDDKAWESLAYVAILGVGGTSLAVILFNYLIKKSGSLFAASVTYAVPMVAVMWGFIYGESIGINHFIGMLAILIGVYLVNRRGSPADRIRKRTK